jgi:hypothetical protein
MSYDDLLPWRALAQRIPKEVLNPTHRAIILTLMTYESQDKGAYFSRENISAELGLSYRAVLDNFHYLSSGLVWKNGVRQACTNSACKAHLGIIKTSHYARANRPQTYRIDMKAIEALASVHLSAPTASSVQPSADLGEPKNIERVPESSSVCTEVQAYKHNKHLINIDKRKTDINTERFNEVILKGVPSELRSTVNAGRNIEELLNEAESLELSRNAIRDYLNVTNWQNVNSAGGIVITRLGKLITDRKKQLALAEQVAENNRLSALEQARRELLKVSPQEAEKRANEIRDSMAWGRRKN